MLPLLCAALLAAQPEGLEARAEDSQKLAAAISQSTELAVSPLLVLTTLGAARWLRSEPSARAQLPWYDSSWLWGPGLVLLALILFKEVIVARIPLAKKPLDALQVLENKVSGVLASPLAVGTLTAALQRALRGSDAIALLGVGQAHAAAMDSAPAAADGVVLVLSFLGALTLYAAVWMASHAIHVLILLSPFALVDNLLRLMRVAVVGALMGLTWLSPWLGAALALVLVALALLLAPASYRWLVLGAVFSTDLLRAPAAVGTRVRGFFVGASGAAPPRTGGFVERGPGGLQFISRRLSIGPRRVVPLTVAALERGLFHAVLIDAEGRVLVRLPPRYQTREAEVAAWLQVPLRDAGLLRGVRATLGWLRGQVLEDRDVAH